MMSTSHPITGIHQTSALVTQHHDTTCDEMNDETSLLFD